MVRLGESVGAIGVLVVGDLRGICLDHVLHLAFARHDRVALGCNSDRSVQIGDHLVDESALGRYVLLNHLRVMLLHPSELAVQFLLIFAAFRWDFVREGVLHRV